MFNKFQRDQQVKRVTELQKRRNVSGYLRDDTFETSLGVQRILASPRRGESSPLGNISKMSTHTAEN